MVVGHTPQGDGTVKLSYRYDESGDKGSLAYVHLDVGQSFWMRTQSTPGQYLAKFFEYEHRGHATGHPTVDQGERMRLTTRSRAVRMTLPRFERQEHPHDMWARGAPLQRLQYKSQAGARALPLIADLNDASSKSAELNDVRRAEQTYVEAHEPSRQGREWRLREAELLFRFPDLTSEMVVLDLEQREDRELAELQAARNALPPEVRTFLDTQPNMCSLEEMGDTLPASVSMGRRRQERAEARN